MFVVSWPHCVAAQVETSKDSAKAADSPKASESSGTDELVLIQSRIADKYSKLEELLIRMAELESSTNPQRSALLLKAAKQSKERLTKNQLNSIVKLLSQQQLKRAADGQQVVQGDLKSLLEMLLSENRSDRLKNEQTRIREYIKEVERLIRTQRGLQGRTEGTGTPGELAKEQSKVADKTGELAKQMEKNEEGESAKESEPGSESSPAKSNATPGKKSDSKNGEGKPGENKVDEPKADDPKPDEPKPDDPQPDEKKPNDDKNDEPSGKDPQSPNSEKSGDKPDGKSNDSSPDKSSSEKKSDKPGDKSEGSSPNKSAKPPMPSDGSGPPMPSDGGESGDSDQTPQGKQQKNEFAAKKRLIAAEDRMRKAQEKLDEAKRIDAAKEQEQAKEELEKAKAQLEEILRQMREEEIERVLAALEGRFRRMLEVQLRIFESTKRIDKTGAADRDREFLIQANRLSFDESKLVLDADRALQLLHDDASSVALPESVGQIRDDMQQVTDRLATAKTDKITQGIEEEIISALEEVVAALQTAQQESKDRKENPMQRPPGNGKDEQALVDQIAELKMIRALQMRVNTRTQRFADLLTNQDDPVGQVLEAELVDALEKLADREKRIQQLTRDILTEKNK